MARKDQMDLIAEEQETSQEALNHLHAWFAQREASTRMLMTHDDEIFLGAVNPMAYLEMCVNVSFQERIAIYKVRRLFRKAARIHKKHSKMRNEISMEDLDGA